MLQNQSQIICAYIKYGVHKPTIFKPVSSLSIWKIISLCWEQTIHSVLTRILSLSASKTLIFIGNNGFFVSSQHKFSNSQNLYIVCSIEAVSFNCWPYFWKCQLVIILLPFLEVFALRIPIWYLFSWSDMQKKSAKYHIESFLFITDDMKEDRVETSPNVSVVKSFMNGLSLKNNPEMFGEMYKGTLCSSIGMHKTLSYNNIFSVPG